ncbi:hypothetical protein LG201_05735 [Methylobacillus gramineus]|uniref:hypothetical protein n=1 Tax=Methylobacillus gramineus TaxID=755169 RepID=UPI001CFFFB7A|nr:hypothetical protein [Methylobacillus gramineus]MCB5184699.1 hypothetical protein [Methylobacillus gramineus]
MATKEQAEIQITELLRELNNEESEYSFHIPGWSPENSSIGLRWMRSQLCEGFYVAYKIEHSAKRVNLKSWELPVWGSYIA